MSTEVFWSTERKALRLNQCPPDNRQWYIIMNFEFTEEQRNIKDLSEEMAEDKFAQQAFTWENDFPSANYEILAENGLLGIALPEKYGGGGYTVVEVLIAVESVGRICPDTAHIISRSSMGPPRAIAELGDDYLKKQYLPSVCSGDLIISIAISEPSAGSDAGSMDTSISRSDDGENLVLNGHKIWVSKVDVAGAFLVYGRFDSGNIGAVIVDKDTPGFTVGSSYENMAGHLQHEIHFENCHVPKENLLVDGERSFKQLLTEFNVERCHNAMMCISCALNAFDKSLNYALEREQFGQPIGEFQGIEWKLADMAIKLEAARLLTYRAASNAVESSPSRLETSIAKVFANEIANEIVDEAVQIHGATGYMKDHPVEYLYRWIRGWKIAGGTVEIQRNNIAAQLKKHGLD